MKSSTYYFHMTTRILTDFQICISVPLNFSVAKIIFVLLSTWQFWVFDMLFIYSMYKDVFDGRHDCLENMLDWGKKMSNSWTQMKMLRKIIDCQNFWKILKKTSKIEFISAKLQAYSVQTTHLLQTDFTTCSFRKMLP